VSKVARDISERRRTEAKASWLASFPERNPNPIVELDLASGVVHYVNPCAIQMLPDLQSKGMSHPLLAGLQEIQNTLLNGKTDTLRREISTGEFFFQRANYFSPRPSLTFQRQNGFASTAPTSPTAKRRKKKSTSLTTSWSSVSSSAPPNSKLRTRNWSRFPIPFPTTCARRCAP
jgi:hypothetical protein